MNAWLREWKRDKKTWMMQQLVVMGISLLIFLLYLINKNCLFAVVSLIKNLPREFSILLGFDAATETGNLSFFLLYSGMILSFLFIWNAMSRCGRGFYADEFNGSVYSLCNQWYSRKQLFRIHYECSVLSFLTGYLMWYLELMLLILIGSLNASQRIRGMGMLTGMMLRGLFVGWMLISLISLFAVAPKSGRRIQTENWISALLLGTLAVGNLYKIRDMIGWFITCIGRDSSVLMRAFKWLDGLYWMSPLTWINPFTDNAGMKFGVIQIFLCTGISLFATKLAYSRYEKRNLVWG